MNAFWETIFLNNAVKDWLFAFSILVICFIFLRVFRSVFIRKIGSYSAKTLTTVDDFFIATILSSGMPIFYVLVFHIGFKYINWPEKVVNLERVFIMISITFLILRMVTSVIGYLFNKASSKRTKNRERERQAKGILLILQIIVWGCGILFLVDNLGYDITTLIAGLGIGGIAIALAAQTILGDLFSYLVIFFDKPFEIGDFIIVQDKMGTVEYIGIKTTRLRTLNGEQLVCSNTDLTNSRVHNYKRMEERRIVFSLGVVYNTPLGKLKLIPQLVKNIIEKLENTRFDRAHFHAFGNFSLNFEVVYYVLSPNTNIYMDLQQAINIHIFELFENEHIEFAFPTQTVFLNKVNQETFYHA